MFQLIVSSYLILFGLISLFAKQRLFISECLVSLVIGIICGPYVLQIVNWELEVDVSIKMVYELSRFVMGLQIMASGVSLPHGYLWKKYISVAMFLGPVMLLMWVSSFLIIWIVFYPKYSLVFSMAIAACITPTDPIISNTILKGKFAELYIPLHVRQLLTCESAINDGLAIPLLCLSILLIQRGWSSIIVPHFFMKVVLYEILMSALFGLLYGYLIRKALKYSKAKNLIDEESFLAMTVVITVRINAEQFKFINISETIAIFAASISFAWGNWLEIESKDSHLQEVVDILSNMTYFTFLGAIVPLNEIRAFGYLKLGALILLFRRIPAVLALSRLIPEIKSFKEAAFLGWFGPMGVGAIYLACTAYFDLEGREMLDVVFFIVMISIVFHGITVPIFHIVLQSQTRVINITTDVPGGSERCLYYHSRETRGVA